MTFIPKPTGHWNSYLVYAVSIFCLLCQREIRGDGIYLYITQVLKNIKWAFCIGFLTFSEEKKKKMFSKALLFGKDIENMCTAICVNNAYKFAVIFREKSTGSFAICDMYEFKMV